MKPSYPPEMQEAHDRAHVALHNQTPEINTGENLIVFKKPGYCMKIDTPLYALDYTRLVQRDDNGTEHIILVHHNHVNRLIKGLVEYKAKQEA